MSGNRKSKRRKIDREKPSPANIPTRRFSALGWAALGGPLSIVLFLLIFGGRIPYLTDYSAQEAKKAAEEICRFGKERMRTSQYQAAHTMFMEALKIKPDLPDAYINISQIYYLTGNIPQAIEWLERAIALDLPQKDLLFNNLGLLYAHSGDFPTALTMFERALSSGMKPEQVYNNIGTANLSQRNYPQAVEAYRAAIEHRPTVRSMYYETLRRVVAEYYGDEELEYVYRAAKGQLERGVMDEELAVYDSVSVFRFGRSAHRQAELYENLARALELNGEFDEAMKYCGEALKTKPNSANLHFQLGGLYFRKMKLNEARRHFERAVRLNPKLNSARLALEEVKRMIEGIREN
ncbi:MAG: tetratricopeptide repeat protein [candidate division Zixibacteria bacterium]|nr:tetratricopeptide repeat protein [Candidatus Tariuqbacter arcticus]